MEVWKCGVGRAMSLNMFMQQGPRPCRRSSGFAFRVCHQRTWSFQCFFCSMFWYRIPGTKLQARNSSGPDPSGDGSGPTSALAATRPRTKSGILHFVNHILKDWDGQQVHRVVIRLGFCSIAQGSETKASKETG